MQQRGSRQVSRRVKKAAAEGHPGECRDRWSLLPGSHGAQDGDAVARQPAPQPADLPKRQGTAARREAGLSPSGQESPKSAISQGIAATKGGTGKHRSWGSPYPESRSRRPRSQEEKRTRTHSRGWPSLPAIAVQDGGPMKRPCHSFRCSPPHRFAADHPAGYDRSMSMPNTAAARLRASVWYHLRRHRPIRAPHRQRALIFGTRFVPYMGPAACHR